MQVGTTTADHAKQDIQDAMAVGLDGFAMNVGQPTQDFAKTCVQELFDGAQGTNFTLFFSFDLLQDQNLPDHIALFNQFQDHPNYLNVDGKRLVSSYGGYNEKSGWGQFKESSNIYLLPNLDDSAAGSGATSPYYTDPSGQLSDFNNIVDGYFSWESAWPPSTGGPANESAQADQTVMSFAQQNQKSYMMGTVHGREFTTVLLRTGVLMRMN